LERTLKRFCLSLVCVVLAGQADAQSSPDSSDALARAALAAFSVGALRREGATTVSVIGASGDEADFYSTSIGAGTDLPADPRVYAELQVAYQNYDPEYLLPATDADLVDVRWSSVALSGGLGWNYAIDDNLTLRPMAIASVGHVFGKAIFDELLPDGDGGGLGELFDDGIFVGGVGAALVLNYVRTIAEGDLELRARQSWLRLVPLDDAGDYDVDATASATNLFGTYSIPIPASNSLRGVVEGSYTRFWGDQAGILRTSWLGTIGGGVEVPTAFRFGSEALYGRAVLRYVFGAGYEGVAIGLGVTF
jgi:hypothetical protein